MIMLEVLTEVIVACGNPTASIVGIMASKARPWDVREMPPLALELLDHGHRDLDAPRQPVIGLEDALPRIQREFPQLNTWPPNSAGHAAISMSLGIPRYLLHHAGT